MKFNGGGSRCASSSEEIKVKGAAPEIVELKFSRHGPIFLRIKRRHLPMR